VPPAQWQEKDVGYTTGKRNPDAKCTEEQENSLRRDQKSVARDRGMEKRNRKMESIRLDPDIHNGRLSGTYWASQLKSAGSVSWVLLGSFLQMLELLGPY
jgi:hypothetical protein